MNLISIVRTSFRELKSWQQNLEKMFDNDLENDVIKLNKAKKGVAISGLGSLVFGKLFNLDIDYESIKVTAAFNLYSSYLDCCIDGTHSEIFSSQKNSNLNIFELISEGIKFLETRNTKNEFLLKAQPLVDYLNQSVLSKDNSFKFILHDLLTEYASSIINYFDTQSSEEKKLERLNIGMIYGKIQSAFINLYSKKKLASNEEKVIQNFCAISTLYDDFVDIIEDGNESYILDKNISLSENTLNLYNHRKKTVSLFRDSKFLIQNSNQRKNYNMLCKTLMFLGDIFFIKKGLNYLAEKIKNNVSRAEPIQIKQYQTSD